MEIMIIIIRGGSRRERVPNVRTVHLQHAADALRLALDGVADSGPGLQHAGVDAGEGQGAHEGVVHDLEGQRGERHLVVGSALDHLLDVRRVHALQVRSGQG